MPDALHRSVALLDERILRAPEIGAELFARLTEAQRTLGLLQGERTTCPFLRPHILTRSQYEQIARAAATLSAVFERLVEVALRDDALFAELGLTEQEARMARIDPGYKRLCVTSRLDAFVCGDDFHFLEYNAENPAGISDQMQLEKILFELPWMREFLAEHEHWRPAPHRRLLRALTEAYRDWGGKRERPQIAIVDWRGVSTESEFFVLKDYFEEEGYPTVIADPHDLTYDGESLKAGEFSIDVLYKRVIIHEFFAEFDETHPVARAYAEGRVCMANSFRTKMAHKKSGFAVLSDPRYENLWTPEQLAVVRRHVPWTRRVRDERTTFDGDEHDLLEFVRRKREQLVLKPSDDYGGHGVVIGWETDSHDWESAIETALNGDYIVQQRVPVEKVSIPMFTDRLETPELLVDFDPFLFLGEVEGGLVRLSASSLVNVSQGGGETALLVLEETSGKSKS